MSDHFVIVGNGAAGFRAAKAIRRADPAAQVSIFTEERHPFYLRRQLGGLVSGEAAPGELIFQSRNAYRRERIDLFLMTRVERVVPDAHEVVLAAGDRVRYDRLLLATGTEAQPLEVPGAHLRGVVRFDTLPAALEAAQGLAQVRNAVILDEGVVGQALAEGLASRGIQVTQLLRGERLWPHLLDEAAGAWVEALLEQNGIALRRRTAARALVGAGGRVIGVETAEGDVLAAELVGYGSRRRPAVDLLEGSGVEVARGVVVDACFRTSRPAVFAAGDVAEPADGAGACEGSVCWQRAWAQGDGAAAGMLDRGPEPLRDALRMRTTVFGRELAVLGRGELAEGGEVKALTLPGRPDVYRRLVFERDRLVGAVVFGTGEGVHELGRMVASGVSRDTAEGLLAPPRPDGAADVLPQTFAHHCPICAAELVIYEGTRAGSVIRCRACSTDLVVGWDGQRGSLKVQPP